MKISTKCDHRIPILRRKLLRTYYKQPESTLAVFVTPENIGEISEYIGRDRDGWKDYKPNLEGDDTWRLAGNVRAKMWHWLYVGDQGAWRIMPDEEFREEYDVESEVDYR